MKRKTCYFLTTLGLGYCFLGIGASKVLGKEAVHFVNVYGDATIIESNGHYGIIDGGEDSDNPTGDPNLSWLPGTEQELLNFIHENLEPQADGKIHFDFMIATHNHSDHIGGLRYVINDDNIVVEKAFLKPYGGDERILPLQRWDNQIESEMLLEALSIKKVPTFKTADSLQKYSNLTLGNMNVKLYNLTSLKDILDQDIYDENDNSIAAVVDYGGRKVFLGGDMSDAPTKIFPEGTETGVTSQVGNVLAAKLNHHGTSGSNSPSFFDNLNPMYTIATNVNARLNKKALTEIANRQVSLYEVSKNGNITLDLEKDSLGLEHCLRTDPIPLLEEEYPLTGRWELSEGYWYFIGEDENFLTGWLKLDSGTYFLREDGKMVVGWLKDENDTWYYFDLSGKMKNGWQLINGDWYYLQTTGEMALGWQMINGMWYYLNATGRMTTGWQFVNGNWFYLNASGTMTTGWQLVGDDWYHLQDGGQMSTGWYQDPAKNWYYLDLSGKMVVGNKSIQEKTYHFLPNGVWDEGS